MTVPVSNRPALVLGLNVTGFGIIRSLSRAGIPVYGVYFDEKVEVGRFSKRSRNFKLPAVRPALDAELLQLCKQLGSPVLYPTTDRWCFLLAENREQLAPHSLFHWVTSEQIASLADKAQVAQLCEQAGVAVPRTFVTTAEMTIAELVAGAPIPCVIKTIDSVGSGLPGDAKTLSAASPNELSALFTAHPELFGRTICQELIEGDETRLVESNVFITADGRRAGMATLRKLRQYPPGFGIATYARLETLPEIETLTFQLLEKVEWKGLANLEFKHRPSDGRHYFIELNPRLPWYNSLLLDAGIDLALLAYRDLTEGLAMKQIARPADPDMRWLHFELDAGAFYRNWKEDKMGAVDWIKSLTKARSYAWFDWRDPKPFVHAVWRRLRQR